MPRANQDSASNDIISSISIGFDSISSRTIIVGLKHCIIRADTVHYTGILGPCTLHYDSNVLGLQSIALGEPCPIVIGCSMEGGGPPRCLGYIMSLCPAVQSSYPYCSLILLCIFFLLIPYLYFTQPTQLAPWRSPLIPHPSVVAPLCSENSSKFSYSLLCFSFRE